MKKVVLVVDNAIIALEIGKNLENEGYLVPLVANTLKEVFKEACDMDLMIMDVDFIPTPRIGEVKSPILFLSSVRESEISKREISTLEVTYDFLYKPFTREQLLDKTRQILEEDCKYS